MTTEERLTRLERKNRRLTLALVLTGVAAALVVTAGMAGTEAVPDVVKAHSFVLLDGNGKTRASLAMIEDGWPRLDLWDENDNLRAALWVRKNGQRLILLDENAKYRASLAVDKDGPGLTLSDENRVLRHLP